MKLNKIENPQKQLKIDKNYLYRVAGVWTVGKCDISYPASSKEKALFNTKFGSISAVDNKITNIYELPE